MKLKHGYGVGLTLILLCPVAPYFLDLVTAAIRADRDGKLWVHRWLQSLLG